MWPNNAIFNYRVLSENTNLVTEMAQNTVNGTVSFISNSPNIRDSSFIGRSSKTKFKIMV